INIIIFSFFQNLLPIVQSTSLLRRSLEMANKISRTLQQFLHICTKSRGSLVEYSTNRNFQYMIRTANPWQLQQGMRLDLLPERIHGWLRIAYNRDNLVSLEAVL